MSGETTVETGQGGGQPASQPNTVPQHRFDEVVGEKNAYKEQVQKLQAQLDETLTQFKAQIDELTPYKTKVEDAQKALTAAEMRAVRLEVAAEAGIPLKLAERLSGDDREALVADAETLKGMIKPATPGNPPPPPRTPAPAAPTPAQLNDAKWVRENAEKVQAYYANGQR